MSINTNGTRIHFLTKTISSCIRAFDFFPLFIRIVVFLMNQWCINSFSRLVMREENISVLSWLWLWCLTPLSTIFKLLDKIAIPSTNIRDMCLFCRLNKQYVNFNIYITNNKCWNNILMSINTNGIRIHFLTKTISSCIRTFEFFPLFHNNNLNIVESGVKHHNHNHDNHIACSNDKINTYHVYLC
jgi:hypothetical protein